MALAASGVRSCPYANAEPNRIGMKRTQKRIVLPCIRKTPFGLLGLVTKWHYRTTEWPRGATETGHTAKKSASGKGNSMEGKSGRRIRLETGGLELPAPKARPRVTASDLPSR